MAYAEVGELARVLSLRAPTAAQGTAMQRVLDTAAFEIDAECGTTFGTAFAATADPLFYAQAMAMLEEVNLERATEHWQQQESPFGIIGLGETVPVMSARDSWDRHAHKLAPLKQTWGIA